MKNKLDKNSKLPSGKSKEASSSDAKSKGKPAKPVPKSPPPASAKKSKPIGDSKPSKASPESKSPAQPAKAGKAESGSISGKSAKSPSQANRETAAPVSKRPAAGKTTARARGKAGSADSAEELSLEEFAISLIKPGETKERIWRTKSFQQHPAQREFGFPDVAPELPGQYSQPKLVLMPKDPEYMFCYWELTPTLIEEKEREKLATGNYRETLKINWESKSLFEPNFTFIPVFFWARKWYFGVPQVGQRYQVELGWLSDSGHFISIIRSNLSELPESWAATQKRLAEQGEVLAYSSSHTKTLGSSEHLVVEDIRSFVPEWNLSSESMSSSSWSRGVSGETAQASPQQSAPAPKASKPRPASPKARLEVSGKVLPGTQVFVSGNAVSTNAQGYFKTEFPYNKDTLNLELTSRSGASRSFTYDLKELVLN
ncbi:MAG: hypothetical protein JWO30_2602 [Fibrobacteres bacterium]|nr:hypothetical protein [Fibrobacterota bacterium]